MFPSTFLETSQVGLCAVSPNALSIPISGQQNANLVCRSRCRISCALFFCERGVRGRIKSQTGWLVSLSRYQLELKREWRAKFFRLWHLISLPDADRDRLSPLWLEENDNKTCQFFFKPRQYGYSAKRRGTYPWVKSSWIVFYLRLMFEVAWHFRYLMTQSEAVWATNQTETEERGKNWQSTWKIGPWMSSMQVAMIKESRKSARAVWVMIANVFRYKRCSVMMFIFASPTYTTPWPRHS